MGSHESQWFIVCFLLSELSVQLTMMSVCLCFVDVSVSLLMKTLNQLSVCLTLLMSNIAVTTQLNQLHIARP